MKKIRVVHIIAGELNGGAARGSYWLHKGLIAQGIDSKIITNAKDDLSDPNIKSLSKSKPRRLLSLLIGQLDSVVLLMFPKRKQRIFSTGFFGLDFKSNEFFKEADIVHLHWVNGIVKTNSLKRVNKPIVWSIRDMWPITGGCHYSLDCKKYISGCGSCPQLNGYFGLDFTKFTVKAKRKAFENVKPIGISEWVTEETNRSSIFGHDRAVTIYNNVDFSTFFPIDKEVARDVLGIKTHKKIILIGSTNIKDFYKGFSLFFESLEMLRKDEYYLCAFGKPDINALESSGFEFMVLGFLNDDVALRLAYSSADVFVAPSIQEAFGKTLVESLACKTLVVCFDSTGPASIVEHKVNGYKAKPFEPEDLANGINWVVNLDKYKDLSHSARDLALKKFDSAVIADQYIQLYKDLLSKDLK
jgi:glycosyltransferase involved in cell wall biosynthesis